MIESHDVVHIVFRFCFKRLTWLELANVLLKFPFDIPD